MLSSGVMRYDSEQYTYWGDGGLRSWGIQVEYLVVALDDAAKKARLSLAQADILKSLARDEALWQAGSGKDDTNGEQ